jgi:hypothetical protein
MVEVTQTPTPTLTPTTTALANCIEGTIPKDTEFSYRDCCYPYSQITGTTGGIPITVCFNPYAEQLNVTPVSGPVVCDTKFITTCCRIDLGYDVSDSINACGAAQSRYYISIPCKATSCSLRNAFAIYTDASCTTLAPDGYYSDGIDYGLQSGGVLGLISPC